ncbi:type I restriction-modification system subunit M N-terminal domain-containing protein [Arthrobacter sp. PGP41]|uniref:type I restriction-modification system subunit M N-terminal domain-containing protein n=1 Tax=Arthrobacter sp. PGP41 TaxID=2079227 RepID=UPI0022774381|nr:type I restriction-modification system subunit M N-terminal domain-containing protein [Arthrobacter sp. PGP41]
MTLSTTEPGHLSQRQLESTLWAAANALRGPVDPGDFKAYVFPVMFLSGSATAGITSTLRRSRT